MKASMESIARGTWNNRFLAEEQVQGKNVVKEHLKERSALHRRAQVI
jgi:hypothetical protein